MRRGWRDTQIVQVLVLGAIGIAAGVVIFPLGPNVSGEQFDASFRAAVEKKAPPSNETSGIKSLDCPRHSIWNNANRTCTLEQEIALLPDASAVYDVDIHDDGCWTARLKEEDSDNEAQLIGEELTSCVAEAERE